MCFWPSSPGKTCALHVDGCYCLKTSFLFLFLTRRLLEDLSSFFSMIIHLLPLLRAGVIYTASLHYYMLLASVQAFTLLAFGDSFAEKWTLISGGSEHEYSKAKLLLLWKASYVRRDIGEGNFPWDSSHRHFSSILYVPMWQRNVNVTDEKVASWAWVILWIMLGSTMQGCV